MSSRPVERPQMSLLFDVWLVNHAMSTLVDETLAASGLSGDDFGVYSLLRGWGPITPSQISRWTGMRPTTVSVALKRLTGRGHAEQTPNPDDGRSYLIGLNAAGKDAHGKAAALFLPAMQGLAAEMSSSQHQERAAIQRIDAAFRTVLGLDDRPYTVAEVEATGNSGQLTYPGASLTTGQERQVMQYIEFIRNQPG
jgi:DNA-binding MarR family transcriptional regulator